MISSRNQILIDAEVQLVCKYLKIYESKLYLVIELCSCHTYTFYTQKELRTTAVEKPVRDRSPHATQDLPVDECIVLLKKHIPDVASRMVSKKLFIRWVNF